jgi:hypothetical protein
VNPKGRSNSQRRAGSAAPGLSWGQGLVLVLTLGAAGSAAAAPFDYTLTARPDDRGARQFEIAVDAMNDTLDVFDVRGDDPDFSGTNVGDYKGGHLRAGWKLSDRWWIDGALWRRKLEYRNDSGSLSSWQLAAQYRFVDGGPTGNAWALRGSVWGNRSGSLTKGSPTSLSGYTMDSVRIESPRDTQWQLDVIGTRGGPDASISWFAGVQRGKVKYSSLSGAAMAGSCPYAVDFGSNSTTLTQTADCTGPSGTVSAGTQFTVDNSALGLNPREALEYSATVYRVGLNGAKRWGAWGLRGGLVYEYHDRDESLEASAQQLSGVYDSGNLSAALEVAYHFTPTLAGFVRGTAWQHQLMGEVPFLYNAVTAKRSDRRYGIVSVGVSIGY